MLGVWAAADEIGRLCVSDPFYNLRADTRKRWSGDAIMGWDSHHRRALTSITIIALTWNDWEALPGFSFAERVVQRRCIAGCLLLRRRMIKINEHFLVPAFKRSTLLAFQKHFAVLLVYGSHLSQDRSYPRCPILQACRVICLPSCHGSRTAAPATPGSSGTDQGIAILGDRNDAELILTMGSGYRPSQGP